MGNNPSDERYCLKCGYSLRGLTDNHCPECGTEFDPENPSTFATRTRPHAIICNLSRPLGGPSHLFAAILAVFMIISQAVPGGCFYLLLFVFAPAWIGVGVFWWIRVVIR